MPADGLVDLPPHEREPSGPAEEPAVGIGNAPGGEEPQEVGHGRGNADALRRRDGVHGGDQGQEIGAVRRGVDDGPAQEGRMGLHVRVGEEQPFGRRGLGLQGGQVEGAVLAEPAGGQGVLAKDAEAGIARRAFRQEDRRGIRGAVVHHQDRQARIVLRQPRVQRRPHLQGLVAGRDADADARERHALVGVGKVGQFPQPSLGDPPLQDEDAQEARGNPARERGTVHRFSRMSPSYRGCPRT